MPLPALQTLPEPRQISERVNVLTRYYNRTPIASLTSADTFPPIYALDTGSATAYAIAPVPGIEVYTVGQPIIFKAANANSGTAPTLNVNGLGAGTITYADGSPLAPGDIAANGYYTAIVASTTPTFHLQNTNGNRVVQVVNTQTGVGATGSTALPADNSTPQSGEGDQYMSLAITPKSTANILQIEVTVFGSHSANSRWMAALFQDSAANALATGTGSSSGVTVLGCCRYTHRMVAGTTSATTFKVRAGGSSGATFTFNGESGSTLFNNTLASSITITELRP